jgi:hypothetical protein
MRDTSLDASLMRISVQRERFHNRIDLWQIERVVRQEFNRRQAAKLFSQVFVAIRRGWSLFPSSSGVETQQIAGRKWAPLKFLEQFF